MRTRAALAPSALGLLLGCADDARPPAPASPPEEPAPSGPVEGGFAGPLGTPVLRTRTAPRRIPPIAGGTLLVLRDDRTAAASDPDHDVVWLVDLAGARPPRAVALRAGDEPGRLAEDGDGGLHVVLRGGGALASIDPALAAVTARRAVCPAPRGVAWNAALSSLHVVCAGGEFVTLGPGAASPVTSRLADDLRDVAVHTGAVYVTRFRAAAVLRVALRDGRAEDASEDAAVAQPGASVAWRMASSRGALVLLSQAVRSSTLGGVFGARGYYGAVTASTGPLAPRVRLIVAPGQGLDAVFSDSGLTVDAAAYGDGERWRVALASPGWAFRQAWPQVREWTETSWSGQRALAGREAGRALALPGQAVAVAYTRAGALVVQTRAPGRLVTAERVLTLYDDPVGDVGHDLFHAATTSGLACASCHPEGGEDGLVWNFLGAGLRRTPSLRGGILRTAPFHWRGDLASMRDLCDEVFTARMGAAPVAPAHADALGRWLDGLPLPARPRPSDEAAAGRGEALFRSAATGCATCHAGPMLTDNRTVDVGTGGPFQTPALVGLAARAPYLHDGCAATLMDRFTDARCGGGDAHGRTAQLTPAQLADLVAYLETL